MQTRVRLQHSRWFTYLRLLLPNLRKPEQTEDYKLAFAELKQRANGGAWFPRLVMQDVSEAAAIASKLLQPLPDLFLAEAAAWCKEAR